MFKVCSTVQITEEVRRSLCRNLQNTSGSGFVECRRRKSRIMGSWGRRVGGVVTFGSL